MRRTTISIAQQVPPVVSSATTEVPIQGNTPGGRGARLSSDLCITRQLFPHSLNCGLSRRYYQSGSKGLPLHLVVKYEQIDGKCPSDCTNGQILVQDLAINADGEVSVERTFAAVLTT